MPIVLVTIGTVCVVLIVALVSSVQARAPDTPDVGGCQPHGEPIDTARLAT